MIRTTIPSICLRYLEIELVNGSGNIRWGGTNFHLSVEVRLGVDFIFKGTFGYHSIFIITESLIDFVVNSKWWVGYCSKENQK